MDTSKERFLQACREGDFEYVHRHAVYEVSVCALSVNQHRYPLTRSQTLHAVDADGNTPLHLAVAYDAVVHEFRRRLTDCGRRGGHRGIVMFLVYDLGMDCNVANSLGMTPYSLAQDGACAVL